MLMIAYGYQSGNYSYLLRVAGGSDYAPAHFFDANLQNEKEILSTHNDDTSEHAEASEQRDT